MMKIKKIKDEMYLAIVELGDSLLKELGDDPKKTLILTPLYGEYIWLPGTLAKTGEGWATFEIRGDGDFFAAFAKNDAQVRHTDNTIYECHFGAYANTKHEIHLYNLGRPAARKTEKELHKKAMLHSRKFRSFWIDLKDGVVRMGRGKTVGKNIINSWTDQFPWQDIRMIGISTWGNNITIRNIKTSNLAPAPAEEGQEEQE